MFDHLLPPETDEHLLTAVFSVAADDTILKHILQGYQEDLFCAKLVKNLNSVPGLTLVDDLQYLRSRPGHSPL